MGSTGLGLGTPSPNDPQAAYRMQLAAALLGIKRSAGWFDWIAALSLVNSVISLFNGNWHFVMGLGVTEVIDYLAQRSGNSRGQLIGFAVTLLVAGFFWLMGRFAKQGQRWALILGMVLYTLDGGLLLLGQDWFSVAFHGYALFMLSRAFAAIKQYEIAKHEAEGHGLFMNNPVG
jgi:MFS family permease